MADSLRGVARESVLLPIIIYSGVVLIDEAPGKPDCFCAVDPDGDKICEPEGCDANKPDSSVS